MAREIAVKEIGKTVKLAAFRHDCHLPFDAGEGVLSSERTHDSPLLAGEQG